MRMTITSRAISHWRNKLSAECPKNALDPSPGIPKLSVHREEVSMSTFNPELGQAIFGNPSGSFELSEFANALLHHLFQEIARVYGNVNQKQWQWLSDPKIPGIEVRHYYWGDDPEEAARPNFTFGRVEIRWYKHPCRSASCNLALTEAEWVSWFNDCLKAIRDCESDLW